MSDDRSEQKKENHEEPKDDVEGHQLERQLEQTEQTEKPDVEGHQFEQVEQVE